MIDIKETIAVSVLNIVLPRLTLMKFFSFIIFFHSLKNHLQALQLN